MVAKIGRGENIRGALSYNQLKVEKEKGQVLLTHNMQETPNGRYSITELYRSFAPYLWANRKTEKPVLHISINPDPKDNVSDEQYRTIAEDYMQRMGYGNQPFVVFKHTDTSRTHIHIVSVSVDENGVKLSDKFDKRRSMVVCRDLEQRYHLVPTTKQDQQQGDKIFHQVDYQVGDIKSQIASVVRYLPKYYQFQSLGAYNALLSLFNITTEEVTGTLHGQQKQGLVYFAMNEQGEKTSNPFKASLFGKHAGQKMLQEHIATCKQSVKNSDTKSEIRRIVTATVESSDDEQGFKKQLGEQGINVAVRRNGTGRIYGITFIDHNSKTVWNGSQLGKDLSANLFNAWWNSGQKPGIQNIEVANPIPKTASEGKSLNGESFELFNFLKENEGQQIDLGVIENWGGLLPEAQGEDYEELAFANLMKKKRRRKKKQ